ncbi:MAG TPA: hypothetical protein ENK06_02400 [Gammaproteobacteria bacterium]|nr:hypothetical protein [Gammaproteobacteria bacterium]
MAWDQTLYFGMGVQKGNELTGFHRSGQQGVFSGIVYRGSKSEPAKIFRDGFVIREATAELHGRRQTTTPGVNPDEGTTRGVISTGKEVTIAAHWAAFHKTESTKRKGWVYAIVLVDYPWAAEGERNMAKESGWAMSRYQSEIMLRGPNGLLNLPGSYIYGARPAAYKSGASKPHWTGIMQRNVRFKNAAFMESSLLTRDLHFQGFSRGEMPDPPNMEEVYAQVPVGLKA